MKLSIRLKLVIFTSCLILLVGGSISLYSIFQERQRIIAMFKKEARDLASVIAVTIANDLYFVDLRSLRLRLEGARVNPVILDFVVTDLEGVVLSDGTRENPLRGQKTSDDFSRRMLRSDGWIPDVEGGTLKMGGPVLMPDGSRIGFLQVRFSLRTPYEVIYEITQSSFRVTLLFLVIGLSLAFWLAGSFSKPILSIVEASQEIGEGKLDTRLMVKRMKVDRQDEIGQLAKSFNAMAESLEEREQKRKQAEEALRQKAEELARSNTELQQFAYIASHDLQEPLRMVACYMQLLARRYKGKLEADADEFINFAVDGVLQMRGLIHALLAYSRLGMEGKEFEPTDCEVVLNNTLADLQLAIRQSGAGVTHDPLPTVMGDGTQLGQLFQNLIGNAIKYRGPEAPRVHVSRQRNGREWLFSVRDNGIGIDPRYAERIFVIFERLHAREEYPGTGIGLTLSKKIVERHGGRIWVESQPGKGSTFYFTIPV